MWPKNICMCVRPFCFVSDSGVNFVVIMAECPPDVKCCFCLSLRCAEYYTVLTIKQSAQLK